VQHWLVQWVLCRLRALSSHRCAAVGGSTCAAQQRLGSRVTLNTSSRLFRVGPDAAQPLSAAGGRKRVCPGPVRKCAVECSSRVDNWRGAGPLSMRPPASFGAGRRDMALRASCSVPRLARRDGAVGFEAGAGQYGAAFHDGLAAGLAVVFDVRPVAGVLPKDCEAVSRAETPGDGRFSVLPVGCPPSDAGQAVFSRRANIAAGVDFQWHADADEGEIRK
jgi:hypothetical protein